MDLQSDYLAESVAGFEPDVAVVVMSLPDPEASELSREINARRAQIENPEMLRRLRSL